MHAQLHGNLWAASLDQEQHERTCNYWYTVTEGSTAHTAYETRAGLDRWLSERGLVLETDLPERGQHGFTRIIGQYRTVSHGEFAATDDNPYRMVAGDAWYAIKPIAHTATLSNGRYTLALITETDGVRVIHTLNPNVKTRLEAADPAAMRALMR